MVLTQQIVSARIVLRYAGETPICSNMDFKVTAEMRVIWNLTIEPGHKSTALLYLATTAYTEEAW